MGIENADTVQMYGRYSEDLGHYAKSQAKRIKTLKRNEQLLLETKGGFKTYAQSPWKRALIREYSSNFLRSTPLEQGDSSPVVGFGLRAGQAVGQCTVRRLTRVLRRDTMNLRVIFEFSRCHLQVLRMPSAFFLEMVLKLTKFDGEQILK